MSFVVQIDKQPDKQGTNHPRETDTCAAAAAESHSSLARPASPATFRARSTTVAGNDIIKLPLNVPDGTEAEITLKTEERAEPRGSFFNSIRNLIGSVAWRAKTLAALVMALGISAQAQNAAPTAPAPQTEMHKRIAELDVQWQATFKREVSDLFTAELDILRVQYRTSIQAAIARVSEAGDLDGALALRNEQKRFSETNDVPQDDAAELLSVKQLRAGWRAQIARMEKDRAARAKAVQAKYDQVLAQAQTALAQPVAAAVRLPSPGVLASARA